MMELCAADPKPLASSSENTKFKFLNDLGTDLNPIENLCDALKNKVTDKQPSRIENTYGKLSKSHGLKI